MRPGSYVDRAEVYLGTLCGAKPHRRTGSRGNREATDFVARTIRPYGYEIDATPFECLDYVCRGAELTHEGSTYEVYASPYSLPIDVTAEMVTVSTVNELESVECEDKILLLRGGICSEQLDAQELRLLQSGAS